MDHSCRRCEGTMEEGLLIEWSLGAQRQLGWGKGPPQTGILRASIASTGLDPFPVTTWRCTDCGLLESYCEASPARSNTK